MSAQQDANPSEPEGPIRLDLLAHLRRQLIAEEFSDSAPPTSRRARVARIADDGSCGGNHLEQRILARLKHEWPAQLVATFSDQDLIAAGCDPDRLRGAVLHALGRRRSSGTDIVIAVTDNWGDAKAILWRGRTLARGKRQ